MTERTGSRYAALVSTLRAAVFDSPGSLDASVRRAAGAGAELSAPWSSYVAKVRESSYTITDADVAALKAAGRSEEEIFEVTVAAATGAALHRLERGLRALRAEA